MNRLKSFVIASLLSAVFLNQPFLYASTEGFRLNSRTMNLDQKTWRYYAPGSLRAHGVLPITKNEGVLIKNLKAKDKRLVYLIYSGPKNMTLKTACKEAKGSIRNLEFTETKETCRLISQTRKGNVSFQWIFEDRQDLKLVSFSVEVPPARKNEVLQDLQLFQKELLK